MTKNTPGTHAEFGNVPGVMLWLLIFPEIIHGTDQKMCIRDSAKAEPAVAEAIAGKTIAKEIYVKGKLVNIAVKG